jgi:parallel beta-helix repeat protein
VNLTLDGVFITSSPFTPIYAEKGAVKIQNSVFSSTGTCDLIHLKNCTAPLIEGCLLKGNNSFDTDGIDYDEVTNGIIRHNNIHDFAGSNNDGIDIGEACHGIIIEKNRIYNCFDKGISIGQGSDAIIRDNLILNCEMGVGVKDTISFASIVNCTFYNNDYSIKCYEKHPGAGGGHASVINSIIAESNTLPYDFDALSGITFTYSLCDSRTISGEGNLKDDPVFIDDENGNFGLAPGSPCINAGDPAGEPDSDGSRADIGARGIDVVIGVKDPAVDKPKAISAFIRNYPNPFRGKTVISFGLPFKEKSFVNVEIFDVRGRMIKRLINEPLSAGIYSVEFDASHMGSGVYYCRIIANGFRRLHPMFLIQ